MIHFCWLYLGDWFKREASTIFKEKNYSEKVDLNI